MKFPYIKFPSSDPRQKWISRPYVPLKIIGQEGFFDEYRIKFERDDGTFEIISVKR